MKELTVAQEFAIKQLQRGAHILHREISSRKSYCQIVENNISVAFNTLTFIKLHGCGLIKRESRTLNNGSNRFATEKWIVSEKGEKYSSVYTAL